MSLRDIILGGNIISPTVAPTSAKSVHFPIDEVSREDVANLSGKKTKRRGKEDEDRQRRSEEWKAFLRHSTGSSMPTGNDDWKALLKQPSNISASLGEEQFDIAAVSGARRDKSNAKASPVEPDVAPADEDELNSLSDGSGDTDLNWTYEDSIQVPLSEELVLSDDLQKTSISDKENANWTFEQTNVPLPGKPQVVPPRWTSPQIKFRPKKTTTESEDEEIADYQARLDAMKSSRNEAGKELSPEPETPTFQSPKIPPASPGLEQAKEEAWYYFRAFWNGFYEHRRRARAIWLGASEGDPKSSWLEVYTHQRRLPFVDLYFLFILLVDITIVFITRSAKFSFRILKAVFNFVYHSLYRKVWCKVLWPVTSFTAKIIWRTCSWIWAWILGPILGPIVRFIWKHIAIFLTLATVFGTVYLYKNVDQNSAFLHCDPCSNTNVGPTDYAILNAVPSLLGLVLNPFYCHKPLSTAYLLKPSFRKVARDNTELFEQISSITNQISTPILDYEAMQRFADEASTAQARFAKSRAKNQDLRKPTRALETFEEGLAGLQTYLKEFLELRRNSLTEIGHRLPILRESLQETQAYYGKGWKNMEKSHKDLTPLYKRRLRDSRATTAAFLAKTEEGRQLFYKFEKLLTLNDHLNSIKNPRKQDERYFRTFERISGADRREIKDFQRAYEKWSAKKFKREFKHFEEGLGEVEEKLKRSLALQEKWEGRQLRRGRCEVDLREGIESLGRAERVIRDQGKKMSGIIKAMKKRSE